jgi:two-component system OmpR family sensor kinase
VKAYQYFGYPLAQTHTTLTQFGLTLGSVSLIGILIVAFATWFIVSTALRPLRRVAATATEVASMELDRGEVDLSVRVPEADTDTRTEVGQVGAALNTMLGHVDDALQARQASESRVRQFVADASHELRTPLASIRGYAELTRRGNYDLPKDVTHSLGRVESEAVRMTSLVEDLLLLARLDAGRDIETTPVDLTRILVDCVSDAHAAGPDHKWELDVLGEPLFVEGDAQRLHQVFVNLLANARVHTPAGTRVRIGLEKRLEKSEKATAVVTITDNGPGIPKNLQSDLFERFARGDSSRSRASGSTGLGLAIVKAVVDAHDGTVSVTSRKGNTTFRVELPLATSE